MRTRMTNELAPSTRAASTMLAGALRKNERIQNEPNARLSAVSTKITPQMLLSSPTLRKS